MGGCGGGAAAWLRKCEAGMRGRTMVVEGEGGGEKGVRRCVQMRNELEGEQRWAQRV